MQHDAFRSPLHVGDLVVTIAPDPNFPFASFIIARILKLRPGEAHLLPHDVYDNQPYWCRNDAIIYKCHHIQAPTHTLGRYCIPCKSTTEWIQCQTCTAWHCPHHKHPCKGSPT